METLVNVMHGFSVALLPINLFFFWRLSRSAPLMGERRSRGALDLATGVTVVVLSALSLVLVVPTLPIAIARSAFLSDSTSFTPSPIIAT